MERRKHKEIQQERRNQQGIVSKPVGKRVYKFTLFQSILEASRLVKSYDNNQLEPLNDIKNL